jgi:2-dehydropantoate 2-reductase
VAREISADEPCLAKQGCLVLFQNGWGNADIFAQFFPQELIYSARVITGFVRLENCVDVTVHADAIHVGNLYSDNVERVVPLCEAIAAGDIPCQAVREIARDLWAKLLFNCPLNSLGAIFGVPYGDLGQSKPSREIMDAIIGEVFDVMRAAGYSTHWASPEEYLVKFYGDLVPLTARHHSSTLQDLRAGKRTEIDALNGAIVALGKKHSLAVPANEIVYDMIKFLESRL